MFLLREGPYWHLHEAEWPWQVRTIEPEDVEAIAERIIRGENSELRELLVESCKPYLRKVMVTSSYSFLLAAGAFDELATDAVNMAVAKWRKPVWLIMFVRSEFLHEYRSKGRERVTESTQELLEIFLPDDREGSPLDCLITQELSVIAREALARDSEDSRRVVELRIDGWSYADIGRELGRHARACREKRYENIERAKRFLKRRYPELFYLCTRRGKGNR